MAQKAAWERWFKATGHAYKIPSWEGRKPKASGWVFIAKKPRAAVKASQAFTPSREGIFQRANDSLQYSGRNLMVFVDAVGA